MEETNYHRIRPKVSVNSTTKNEVGNSSQSGELNPCENDSPRAQLETSVEFWENSRPKSWQEPRSFYEKLRIFDKEELRYPNRLKGMVFRALIFLTFPVIFYAGFSYGSNIVWFNVLNGTTSLILSRKPYDFASSTVGLAYLAPFTGMTIGYPCPEIPGS